MQPTEHRFTLPAAGEEVSGLLLRPADARCLYVFGHGAGAGMAHAFMESAAEGLAQRGVATFRYNFPYMEAAWRVGKGRGWPPSPRAVLLEAVRAAVAEAGRLAPGLALVAGGKSMGGRMTSLAAAAEPLPGVRGLAFFGFPLHTKKKPATERARHLAGVGLPMLFLQGTRDDLADLELLREALEEVRPEPDLHVLEGADHGFHVLKRSGRTDAQVLAEACDAFAGWTDRMIRG